MNLDKFKIGYVLLWKNNEDFLGNLIYKAQLKEGFSKEDAQWIHVDCCLGGASVLRINPPRATLVEDIRKYYKGRSYKLLRYNDLDYELRQRYKVAIWSATNCNKAYDYLGVLKFKLAWLWHSKSNPFCSEGMVEAFQKEIPAFMYGMKPYRVMPAHFSHYDKMEVVDEGIA